MLLPALVNRWAYLNVEHPKWLADALRHKKLESYASFLRETNGGAVNASVVFDRDFTELRIDRFFGVVPLAPFETYDLSYHLGVGGDPKTCFAIAASHHDLVTLNIQDGSVSLTFVSDPDDGDLPMKLSDSFLEFLKCFRRTDSEELDRLAIEHDDTLRRIEIFDPAVISRISRLTDEGQVAAFSVACQVANTVVQSFLINHSNTHHQTYFLIAAENGQRDSMRDIWSISRQTIDLNQVRKMLDWFDLPMFDSFMVSIGVGQDKVSDTE